MGFHGNVGSVQQRIQVQSQPQKNRKQLRDKL